VAFIALMDLIFFTLPANAKMVNLATGSICLFMIKEKIIWAIVLQWPLVMLLVDGLQGKVTKGADPPNFFSSCGSTLILVCFDVFFI
jgi:hypothetical protein